jgi:uncharacterized membrane protein YkvA (DUF1232 family)
MTLWEWGLIALATFVLLGFAAAATLSLIKRRVRRLAGHAPEIRVLCRSLIGDPRVLPHHRFVLRALVRYLELPLDMIPDLIPIVGRLDDALITALAIRVAMRSANPEMIRQYWPGPQPPPKGILRRAKGGARSAAVYGSARV